MIDSPESFRQRAKNSRLLPIIRSASTVLSLLTLGMHYMPPASAQSEMNDDNLRNLIRVSEARKDATVCENMTLSRNGKPVKGGDPKTVLEGDVATTSKQLGQTGVIYMPKQMFVVLQPGSQLLIKRIPKKQPPQPKVQGPMINLRSPGALFVRSTNAKKTNDVIVETRNMATAAVNTAYIVRVEAAYTTVVVFEGTVNVHLPNSAKTLAVQAGRKVVIADFLPVGTDPINAADRAELDSLNKTTIAPGPGEGKPTVLFPAPNVFGWAQPDQIRVACAAFSSDARYICAANVNAAGRGSLVYIWDRLGHQFPAMAPIRNAAAQVHAVAFGRGPNALQVFSGDDDGNLILWDALSGRAIAIAPPARPASPGWQVLSILPVSDGKTVLAGGMSRAPSAGHLEKQVATLDFFDATNLSLIPPEIQNASPLFPYSDPDPEYDQSMLKSIALSPNGRFAALGIASLNSANRKRKGEVLVIEVKTRKLVSRFSDFTDDVASVVFLTDSDVLVGCWDLLTHLIRFENLENSTNETTAKRVWKSAEPHEGDNALNGVDCVAAAHHGLYGVSGAVGVKLWNRQSPRPLDAFSSDGEKIMAVSFSSNDEFVYAVGASGHILSWQVKR